MNINKSYNLKVSFKIKQTSMKSQNQLNSKYLIKRNLKYQQKTLLLQGNLKKEKNYRIIVEILRK